MVGHAFPNRIKDAPEVVRQTRRADVLVVDFLSANAQRLERLGIGIRLVQVELRAGVLPGRRHKDVGTP